MAKRSHLANPTIEPVYACLARAASDTALALGLVRVLTLMPLYDASLDELERHLAQTWESLLELKRLLEDEHEELRSRPPTSPRSAAD